MQPFIKILSSNFNHFLKLYFQNLSELLHFHHVIVDEFSCYRFVCKNNGVLFENQLLQIGIKSEYRQNLGNLGQKYVFWSTTAAYICVWWHKTKCVSDVY